VTDDQESAAKSAGTHTPEHVMNSPRFVLGNVVDLAEQVAAP
jgi:hypothetical protein